MTTISNIAQRILDENNWTVSNISLINLEYLIKNAVDYINMMTETTISFAPTGTGTLSLTASDKEIVTTKFLTTLLLRAYLDRGPNTSVQGLTVSSLLADPQYATYDKMVDKAMERLVTRSLERT